MIREKNREGKLFYNFDLDKYVPNDHLLREIDDHVDFDFIRDRVKHLYSNTGKPAIDPVVLVKMLFVGYLYNIKSERQLEKEFQVNLAYKWFIKYDIDESIPDHSVISQTRRRKFSQSTLFQDVFDQIVLQCMQLNLLDGETILTDSTHIKANASMKSLRPIVEYLTELDATAEKESVSNSMHVSSSDPESKIMHRSGKPRGLHYLEHRSLDKSGFITDVFVTPGNASDHNSYVERLVRQQQRFGFPIHNCIADKGYGYINVYHELSEMNIRAFIPMKRPARTSEIEFDKNDFNYNKTADTYTCPAGKELHKRKKIHDNGVDKSHVYAGKREYCSSCHLRPKCTRDTSGGSKTLQINIYDEDVTAQLTKEGSSEWRQMMKLRKYLVEGSFADAKMNHGLARARLRGIQKIHEQCLLIAVVQNIKKMIKHIIKKEPVAEMAQALSVNYGSFVPVIVF
jgi:transposase